MKTDLIYLKETLSIASHNPFERKKKVYNFRSEAKIKGEPAAYKRKQNQPPLNVSRSISNIFSDNQLSNYVRCIK